MGGGGGGGDRRQRSANVRGGDKYTPNLYDAMLRAHVVVIRMVKLRVRSNKQVHEVVGSRMKV